MNHVEQAQAALADVTKRRNQAIDGTSRGRHRGWDAAGLVAVIAGFAVLDIPVPSVLRIILLAAATVLALTCFTRAGQRAKVTLHQSQLTGRFWAVLAGLALAVGALVFGALWLTDRAGIPFGGTLTGVFLAAVIVLGEPVYRALLRRRDQ